MNQLIEIARSIAQHSDNKVKASQSEDEFEKRVEDAVKKALKEHGSQQQQNP